jgi:hypothetical protein
VDNLLVFLNFLEKLGSLSFKWILLITAIAIVIIATIEYKKDFLYYAFHRRNKWFFIVLIVPSLLYFSLSLKYAIPCYIKIPIFFLLVSVLFAFVKRLKPIDFKTFFNPFVNKYMKRIEDGYTIELENDLKMKHWFVFTAKSKLEFQILKYIYFKNLNDYKSALVELSKVDKSWLYEKEMIVVNNKKAFLFSQIGNMKASKEILGSADTCHSKDPMVWITYSFISENEGNIDAAFQYADKARGIIDSNSEESESLKGLIYNNYARSALLCGYSDEAHHYYGIAWNHVKKSKNIFLIHDVADNLIARKAIMEYRKEEIETIFSEYRSFIKTNSIMNQLEYLNCRIAYYRQVKDFVQEYNSIKGGFLYLVPELDSNRSAIFTSSVFQMLMNGHYKHDWFDEHVKTDYRDYASLTLIERLQVFTNFMGILRQDEFKSLAKAEPYAKLNQMILDYYYQHAIRDINNALSSSDGYDIVEYYNLMLSKLFILNIIEGKEHIEKSKDIYLDLSRYLKDKGLLIESLRVVLILLDTCCSPTNTLVSFFPYCDNLYLCDYAERLPPPPEPILQPDKIHLSYPRFCTNVPFVTAIVHLDVVQSYLEYAIEIWHQLKNHPYKIESSGIIANILCLIGKKVESKEFFDYYKNSGISDYQMASWFRDYIREVNLDLSCEPDTLKNNIHPNPDKPFTISVNAFEPGTEQSICIKSLRYTRPAPHSGRPDVKSNQ